MDPQVYIFIGHSGSGKGTQAKLLVEKLRIADPNRGVFYLETGSYFRELIESNSYTATQTKKMMDDGKLPPSFLGIHVWAHAFIKDYDGTSHVVIDGTPRVAEEVSILLSAIAFYGWQAHALFLEVSDEWASDKMKNRGRSDDRDEKDVWGRIQWYHESVMPTLELLKRASGVDFHTIHGEQAIESVHADIVRELDIS